MEEHALDRSTESLLNTITLPTLMTCRDATTSTFHEWARRLVTPSRKGIRILRPGDGG